MSRILEDLAALLETQLTERNAHLAACPSPPTTEWYAKGRDAMYAAAETNAEWIERYRAESGLLPSDVQIAEERARIYRILAR